MEKSVKFFVVCNMTFDFDECLTDWFLQPAQVMSPYRNGPPQFYYGAVGAPPPPYGMSSRFGSPIPHSGLQYEYGLYPRPRVSYSPVPSFPPGNFGGTLSVTVSVISFYKLLPFPPFFDLMLLKLLLMHIR